MAQRTLENTVPLEKVSVAVEDSELVLSPGDLYRLRQAALSARRSQIRAEMAQQNLKELILSLEQRYRLLGQVASLDVNTGKITLNAPPRPKADGI